MRTYWIPTKLQIADQPSREIDLNEEFLPKIWFTKIQQLAQVWCDIDTMASVTNFKCKKFITRSCIGIPHENIIGHDFLNMNHKSLSKHSLYCFPPKNLLTSVLNHFWLYFQKTNFIIVFHVFLELPLGIERFLNLNSCKLIRITDKEAITYFPSETIVSIKVDNNVQKLNGTANIRPKAIYMLVNKC